MLSSRAGFRHNAAHQTMNCTAPFRRLCRLLPGIAVLLPQLTHPLLRAADPFAEGVRPTPWLSPADQQQTFRLPPGFEIQLVAAEPDINKPMNMAFDALGRLWVTTSIEYPYAAPTNKPGRDRIMIFEDFGPNGRARKVTEFAAGLNIPIGIYPFLGPPSEGNRATRGTQHATWKCIAWSIPYIWLFEDTDGDGKADRREPLYGPFDYTRDTHGNQASFRRGFDGWLYCTHGYNNDSHVKGRDGHQVDLNSGNTYRIRLDGSRIEHHTHGQVNPYGLAFDEFGNLFSSDCHSEPIYQLLAGGYYPSFGKPHDGLGFAPRMMEKPRGSTAIDGISIYADDLWPAEFHGNIFIGDVMTSRVYRDRLTEEGSTRTARPMPDFVTTTDPWFRPVDTCLGPDGALYIADFYNRIIGHYEVPLTHPGRDRTSGRIWRVVKSRAGVSPARPGPWQPAGAGETPALLWPRFDFAKASLKELVAALGHPNLSRRMLAMNAIADRFGSQAARETDAVARNPDNPQQEVHALWLLHRLDASLPETLVQAAKSADRLVRVHAQRIATSIFHQVSRGSLDRSGTDIHHISAAHDIATLGLKDSDPLVQRCATEAIALHRVDSSRIVRQLLDLRARVATNDTHLLYVLRKAIRDQLRMESVFNTVLAEPLNDQDSQMLMDVSLGVTNAAAATFLLRQLPALSRAGVSPAQPGAEAPGGTEALPVPRSPSVADILKHAARYAPESELDQLASFANTRIPTAYGLEQYQELERQFALFKSVDDGLMQRGRARPEAIRAWGTNLVWKFFGALDTYHSWTALPCEPNPSDSVPWDIETRTGTDGRKRQLTSSLPHGEDLTGVLRSPDFPLPAKLSFWLCGHDGFPDKPAGNLNSIRLRLQGSGQILTNVPAPRNDTARRITWEFPQHAGKTACVEAVDGDEGRAYAWIAFGDFEPALSQLRPSEFSPRKMRDWFAAATDSAVRLQMKETAPMFARWLSPRFVEQAEEKRGKGEKQPAAPPPLFPSSPLPLFDANAFADLTRAWVALEPTQAVPILASALSTNYGPAAYREAVAGVLASQNTSAAQAAVLAAMKTLPLKKQEAIAITLASAKFSAETLLTGLENGAISPRVLYRNSVNTRLKNSKPPDWETRLKKLTAKLPPPDDARNKLIADRRAGYSTAPGQADAGKLVFVKNCAACHKIGNEGALIGPQLDGIGQRGLERLLEDILDPNRNIDGAFRTTLLMLKDGEVTSGLFRREEGETIVLAESTGKEITVAKKDIAERRDSEVSLMPENFGELLSAEDFNHLMAYLLSNRAQP
jgi:putative heme-binding domain-containing protein